MRTEQFAVRHCVGHEHRHHSGARAPRRRTRRQLVGRHVFVHFRRRMVRRNALTQGDVPAVARGRGAADAAHQGGVCTAAARRAQDRACAAQLNTTQLCQSRGVFQRLCECIRRRTLGALYHASQSLASVGSRPMLQHLYRPTEVQASWHTMNTSICGSTVCFGLRYGANTAYEHARRTCVEGRDALERVHDGHVHDHHTENLDAVAAHVEHHEVHRDRLDGRDRGLPCLGLLDGGGIDGLVGERLALVLLGERLRQGSARRTVGSVYPITASATASSRACLCESRATYFGLIWS